MILVTAAGGNQGRRLVPALASAGHEVRGLRASPDGVRELLDLGAKEGIAGDVRDPATLADAMSGVEAVYHICPGGSHLWEREMGFAVIDAAIAAGVGHLVYSSVLHPIVTDLVQHATKRDVEERLVSSPVNFTILQPADYMQFLVPPVTFENDELVAAWSITKRHSTIDLDDLAAVAVKVLSEGETHYGATYELCAPGCFNAQDIAEAVADVTGRPIRLSTMSVDEFVAAQAEKYLKTVTDRPEEQEGFDFQMRVLRGIGAWYESHDFVGNPNVLAMLLGRRPTTLEEFIRKEYDRCRLS